MHSFRVISVLLVGLGGLGVAAKSLSLEGIPSCAVSHDITSRVCQGIIWLTIIHPRLLAWLKPFP